MDFDYNSNNYTNNFIIPNQSNNFSHSNNSNFNNSLSTLPQPYYTNTWDKSLPTKESDKQLYNFFKLTDSNQFNNYNNTNNIGFINKENNNLSNFNKDNFNQFEHTLNPTKITNLNVANPNTIPNSLFNFNTQNIPLFIYAD